MASKVSCARFLLLLVTPTVFNGGCNPGGPKKTTPTITWPTPAAITYGTALSSAQLDATASVPGTFAYTPTAGTVPNAGTQTLSVAFTPSDTSKYNTASANVSLTVNKATPTITWAAPAPITQGTALSATQLDATASVPGTFVYTPPASTVLAAGTQTLSVACTVDLSKKLFQHAFPNGSTVSLIATPPDTANAYDVKWTGACGGDSVTSGVVMSQDQHCYVSFTPFSSR